MALKFLRDNDMSYNMFAMPSFKTTDSWNWFEHPLSNNVTPFDEEKNKCESGAYIVKMISHNSKVTLVASGSEVELALDVHNALKENSIESKVVSMPCQELFDKQSDDFKKDILDKESLIVTIEAGNVSSWKKYLGGKGISLGIDRFGESAPYKKVYEHLNLSVEKIVLAIQERLRK